MNKSPALREIHRLERIAISMKPDKAKAFQKLCLKEAFWAETFALAEENLGRRNLGKPIEGISKSSSSEIDFTASKIIKPATPTITSANRMVLRPIEKLREWKLKPNQTWNYGL